MVLTSAANAEPSAPEPFGRKDISICSEKMLGISKCTTK
jgi:hypothetical protein